MSNAMHLLADGTETVIRPENGKDFTLKEAQSYVGGYVEVVSTRPDLGFILLVNEDGYLIGERPNDIASKIAGQLIVGDAVYCPANMFV